MTFTGAAALTNNTALSVNTTTTFTGVISGVGSLTLSGTPVVAGSSTSFTGTGNLILQGTSNAYTMAPR